MQEQELTDPLLGIQRVGGASSFMDLQPQSSGNVPAPVPVVHLPIPMPITPETQAPVSRGPPSNASEQDVPQPEYEMTPQVSHRDQSMNQPLEVPRVERESSSGTQDAAPPQDSSQVPAPSSVEVSLPSPSGVPAATDISGQTPLPVETDEWEEDAQICDECVLTSQDLGLHDVSGDSLLSLTRVQSGPQAQVTPLAEDNLPHVEDPLIPREHQAFCLKSPLSLSAGRSGPRT